MKRRKRGLRRKALGYKLLTEMFLTACVGIKVRHFTENMRQGGEEGWREARETRKPKAGSKKINKGKKREMETRWGAREVREARAEF